MDIKFILSISILLLTLLQLYFQYSVLLRNCNYYYCDNKRLNQLYIFGRRYKLNFDEIHFFFNYNALMKINILKKFVLRLFEKWHKEDDYTLEIYELYYLIIYDFIIMIFLCLFLFKVYRAGIVKTILQFLKFFFTLIRFGKKMLIMKIFLE